MNSDQNNINRKLTKNFFNTRPNRSMSDGGLEQSNIMNTNNNNTNNTNNAIINRSDRSNTDVIDTGDLNAVEYEKLIYTLNIPIAIWTYDNETKRFYLKNANKSFIDEFKIQSLNLKMKHIYNFYKKDYNKYYITCIKKKENQTYEIYFDGKKIMITIVYISDNIILEKLEIIKIDEHELLNDPFNMIIIVQDKNKICNANFLFLRNTEYSRYDILQKDVNTIFTDKLVFENYNIIKTNNLILNNKRKTNVELYIIKLNGEYDIIIIKDISHLKKDMLHKKIFTNLETSIVIFDKDKDKDKDNDKDKDKDKDKDEPNKNERTEKKLDKKYERNIFADYKCSDTNKSFEAIFGNGYGSGNGNSNIVGKKIKDVFSSEIFQRLHKNYADLLIAENNVINNIKFGEKYYNFNCFLIEGHLFGIIIHDITNSMEMTNLKYARDNFLIGIIDNLRKPIAGISNSLSLLSETHLNNTQRNYVNEIINHNFLLSILISDFTDYTNLKLSKIKVENEPFNIRDEIDNFYESVLLRSKEKNIDTLFEIDSNVPPYVISDKQKFMQILKNLIYNSIKFTFSGKIHMKVYIDKARSLNNNDKNDKNDKNKLSSSDASSPKSYFNLNIEISDTGIGIDKENIARIFDSFFQINKSIVDDKKNTNDLWNGSGLGLSISRGLCELMGGKIWATSEISVGSKFCFYIPMEEYTNMNEIENKTVEVFKDKHVLIVDENSLNRISISKIVLSLKMHPQMASTADESLFMINNNHFDICFIDIDSTNTFSNELASKIKTTNKFIQIVAMTSFENREYNKDIFNYLILKPIYKSTLIKLFINIFSDRDIIIKKQSFDETQAIENNIPIIIYSNHIDSDIKNHDHYLKNLTSVLSANGYKNVKIINMIDSSIESLKNSILFLDINIDDFDLNILPNIKKIKNSDTLTSFTDLRHKVLNKNKNKIFIVSIMANDNKYKKILEKNGVDAFLNKPVDNNELKALLKVISRRL